MIYKKGRPVKLYQHFWDLVIPLCLILACVDNGKETGESPQTDSAEIAQQESPYPELTPEIGLDQFICPKRFPISQEGESQMIPYCSNVDLSNPEEYPQVTRLVIVIHGSGSSAVLNYKRILAAAEQSESDSSTIFMAPQFVTEEHISDENLDGSHAFWTTGWASGSLSKSTEEHPRTIRISSYDYLDTMLAVLLEQFQLQNLTQVVIVGHSAGGQLVQRYAAASIYTPSTVPIKYIVTNPSSFLYFTERRWVTGSEYQFQEPLAEDINNCPTYNEWRYGLENLYSYMQPTGTSNLLNNYFSRDVVVLVGEDDNDPNNTTLSTTCSSMMQGSQRLERGIVYYHYLKEEHQIESSFAIVPNVAHSSEQMFNSDCAQKYVFDVSTAHCSPYRVEQ